MGQLYTIETHPLSGYLHINDPTGAHSASGHKLPSLTWRSFSIVHHNLLGVSCIPPRLGMHEYMPVLRRNGGVAGLSRLLQLVSALRMLTMGREMRSGCSLHHGSA